ncbi:oxidoreductase [Stenotrophomonas rhizophila]|uniref:oxidoreductase n=1 Tax=Stenotrophomonas rhizophila TaxID=216778 RepID=UPI001E649D3D|nr:oxidoreductase [Stenotrophomonas rhizophila]MCC7633741.1 oxidoreductase [Stenotrophomonas rhizophila]MCC7663687.1 oxidoreductase [Stenotrophomonas rhizophila]
MAAALQVGLIGYGLAGSVFHAPLIQHTPGLALHSIVSSQRDRLLRSFTDVHIHPHPQPLLDDPAIDAVVIATPNAEHAPLALAALQAGKHVLVDKPFTLDVAQAEAVVQTARDAERIVTVFQNRRFDADFLSLRQLLDEGRLGRIAECHSHFDRYRPQVRTRWRESAAPGAGLWMDLGPHLLDQMLQLFGWPEAISADLAAQRDDAHSDDYFHAVLHYPRHRAIVHAGSLVAASAPRFAVHGSAGSYLKEGRDVQEEQLRDGVAPGAPGWGLDPLHGQHVCLDADGRPQRSSVDNVPGDYRRLYAQFRDAMLGVGPPTVSAEQAVQLMRLLEAGQQSAQRGMRIDLR